MKIYLLQRNTAVLLVLVLLTLTSWYLGLEQSHAQQVSQWSGIAMLLLAFFKVRLVIQHFMEVREAPLMLRLACEGWVVVAASVTIAAYLGVFS